MAKPQALQQLKHGKILSKSTAPNFVETWNYTVNRLENLKGDADINPQTGHIKVDNTNPENPVIRLVNGILSGGGGGGGAGYVEPWELDIEDDEIINPYFQIGTSRGTALTDDISLSDFQDTDTTRTLYCVMDISNLSAKAAYEPRNDWNHHSVKIFELSCLSVGTGEIDPETGDEISVLTRKVGYACRYSLSPVWESFYR